MFGGLEGLIILIPFVYLGMYIAAYFYTRRKFP